MTFLDRHIPAWFEVRVDKRTLRPSEVRMTAASHFMRDRYHQTGESPSLRPLSKASGVPIKELYQLFPKGPAKLAAKIAGVPKPRGCI